MWTRLWIFAWPLPAVALLLLAGTGERMWVLAFFTLTLLWPATLAVLRVAGRRAASATAAVLSILLTAQVLLPTPHIDAHHMTLDRPFEHEGQVAKHTIRLPLHSQAWQRLWSGVTEPQAFLYAQVMYTEPGGDPPLAVQAGGHDLGRLSQRTRSVSQGGPPHAEQVWHRLPVPRGLLERSELLEVQLAPLAGETLTPGTVRLLGGINFQPTAPDIPSAFFDGVLWSTDPVAVLPGAGHPPGFSGPVRYFVELRILDPETRRFLAIFY